ncbi:MAG TPA: hypothetical protein VFA39_19965 [Steroidobacteraceae bacterium]|nr:hypothetical protein [Steroidobacteraceae bacterium]
MFKFAIGLLAAMLFIAAAHAGPLPSVEFAAAPPAAEQARAVARAEDLVRHMAQDAARVSADPQYYTSPSGAIEVLWRGYALASVTSQLVCSALNVLASLNALPGHAAAVCLRTDEDEGQYTVVLFLPASTASKSGERP